MLHVVVECCHLTWFNKAVLWFFFDLGWLLFVPGLVLVTVSTWWSALRSEGSMDTVCRQMTLLQQQAHCLREQIDLLSVSGQLGSNQTACRRGARGKCHPSPAQCL